jgi:hypothetical protein
MTKRNAQNAQQAEQLVKQTRAAAEQLTAQAEAMKGVVSELLNLVGGKAIQAGAGGAPVAHHVSPKQHFQRTRRIVGNPVLI